MPIIINSKIEGYRRAGMAHSKTPVTHPDDTFSEAQLAQLKADPRITVTLDTVADSSDSNSGDSGAMDAPRLAELVAHIASLDKENEALWKQDKTPKADAFPKGTTAEERAAAWEAYVAQLDVTNGAGA
ncbi:MAG: HI1506-related protein [Marinomonas sp.]|jgi:hypothetical protein|uniref:HI1506-related protein n=1 Tax=Marinomonas sp. TaxID=1904862 RepID=UPI003F9CA20D